MTSETERLTKLVRDLLLLTRTDEGGLALQVADVDLDDLAGELARALAVYPPLKRAAQDDSSLDFLLGKMRATGLRCSTLDAATLGVNADHFAWMQRPDAVARALASGLDQRSA